MNSKANMKLKLLVIRSKDIAASIQFYEKIGLEFDYHRHGNGPLHYSCLLGETVFELYPLLKQQKEADRSTRLGFEVEQLDRLIEELREMKIPIIQEPKESEFGYFALVKDLDGRKVELSQILT
jgi:predicted lactoylglutathione lyase